MNKRLILHVSELTMTIIFVFTIWSFYKGEDYVLVFFESLGYLTLIFLYCFVGFLLPSMRKACDVSDVPKQQWWRILLSNAPWCVLTLVILLLFSRSLGYFACLPIVIPNSVYLLYQFIRLYLKTRMEGNNDR